MNRHNKGLRIAKFSEEDNFLFIWLKSLEEK